MSYNENYMHYTGTWLANEPYSYAAQQERSQLVMPQQPKIYRDLLLCAHAGEKDCEFTLKRTFSLWERSDSSM